MRSSKSRSRSKNNRNRSMGNVVNRVFDSSGPEGKVRGTPQQIIDKYNQLARDAQLSNDRVAAVNFQQHAEHYTRMLAEALREQQERQAQNQQNQQERQNRNNAAGGPPPVSGEGEQPDLGTQQQPQAQPQSEPSKEPAIAPVPEASADMVETPEGSSDSPLVVETPENQPPKPQRRTRRKPKPAVDHAPAAPDAAE